MDWFSLWFNGAYMTVQGLLQVYFSGWITGKRPQARHVALYPPNGSLCRIRAWIRIYGCCFGPGYSFLLWSFTYSAAITGIQRPCLFRSK